MSVDEIVIVAAKRTPMGHMLGNLSELSAPDLNAAAHRAAIEQAGIEASEIDEILSGCVLQAGIGQAPARQAAIKAGIPTSVNATTLNKMCGSGMKAAMLGHDLIKAGSARIVLASGMESMSNAPYLLNKARSGLRMGHTELKDHMFLDGLEDAFDGGKPMGYFAEQTAKHLHFSREDQDRFALRSLTLATESVKNGRFHDEITPVIVPKRTGNVTISEDEIPGPEKIAKIPHLKPAFLNDGTVTAANSSSISDGAASLILMKATHAERRGLKPLATIISHATHAQESKWFTTAPAPAIRHALKKANWRPHEVDLYEINEAFAVVAMATIKELELDLESVNIHGGACALGHPIGASGARIIATLIYALKQSQKKRGVASLCIGGGEATAMAIEII